MQIPVIETERLVLRAFRDDTDFEPYADFYASDLTKYYGGPLDRSAAWRAAAAMMGHWVIRGYGAWAVEEKSSGDFCGVVGLWFPEGWPEREITWAIVEHKQGLGIAAEAAIRSSISTDLLDQLSKVPSDTTSSFNSSTCPTSTSHLTSFSFHNPPLRIPHPIKSAAPQGQWPNVKRPTPQLP